LTPLLKSADSKGEVLADNCGQCGRFYRRRKMSVMYPDYCPMCGERDLAVRLEAKFVGNEEDYTLSGFVGQGQLRKKYRGLVRMKGFLNEQA